MFFDDEKFERLVDVGVFGLSPGGMAALSAAQTGNAHGTNYYWFVPNDFRDLDEIADSVVANLKSHGVACDRVSVKDLERRVTRHLGVLDPIIEATS